MGSWILQTVPRNVVDAQYVMLVAAAVGFDFPRVALVRVENPATRQMKAVRGHMRGVTRYLGPPYCIS